MPCPSCRLARSVLDSSVTINTDSNRYLTVAQLSMGAVRVLRAADQPSSQRQDLAETKPRSDDRFLWIWSDRTGDTRSTR